MDVRNKRHRYLSQVVSGIKTKFTYKYDFGNDWLHDIITEKILPLEEGVAYPVCLTGTPARGLR